MERTPPERAPAPTRPDHSRSPAGIAIQETVSQEIIDPLDIAKWALEANCRGRSDMFPSSGGEVEKAKKVCEPCPVKVACLEYALITRQEHGMWGGTNERERRRILRRRRVTG